MIDASAHPPFCSSVESREPVCGLERPTLHQFVFLHFLVMAPDIVCSRGRHRRPLGSGTGDTKRCCEKLLNARNIPEICRSKREDGWRLESPFEIWGFVFHSIQRSPAVQALKQWNENHVAHILASGVLYCREARLDSELEPTNRLTVQYIT